MTKEIRKQVKALEKLKLNELQARFAEIVGEETRAPNRKFLLRRITEALEAQAAEAPTAGAASSASAAPKPAPKNRGKAKPDGEADAATGDSEVKLTKLSVEELRARYAEVIQRETSSSNRAYLIWKLRQAEKGRIRVGPVQRRHGDGPQPDFKVLPLRMEAELVAQLDEARERLGLTSRMELLRRSLHAFLLEAGEVRVAELFAPPAE